MSEKTTSFELKFPSDIMNPGTATLDHEIPWLVPDSVRMLQQLISDHDRVLDIGSGGSTFFYARRCQHVHAIETVKDYFDLVQQRISEKQLHDKIHYVYSDSDTVKDRINDLPDKSFDVVSIDTMTGQSRTTLFEAMLPKWTGKIIVMDNWAHKKLWPGLFAMSGSQLMANYGLDQHCVLDFEHTPYKGRGTRIIFANGLIK